MAKGSRQKRPHQDVGVVGAEPSLASSGQSGADTRKKAKTGVEDHGESAFNTDTRCVPDIVISSAPFFKREQRKWRTSSSASKSQAPPNADLSQSVKNRHCHCQ